jgi:allantoicase
MTTPRSDFTDLPNLAGERFGTAVIAANDEFFAPKEGLIGGTTGMAEGLYTERGKWMDGWETRRRRRRATTGPLFD